MLKQILSLGACRFEVLADGGRFLGLGAIHTGDTQVRAGRLPLRPATQTFTVCPLPEQVG